ncbi:type II secretion system protein [Massilia sp. CCM 9210]|uniref:type II secretion system protein n=1 Tax=Massilia scottii TaxID=3057166 RepID=UPI0027964653|nr:type II secretion system protein [Massilia sp. CCM 9210]MDQ1817091.1 type II secretion system protein [Massilia sp. CCM 9210]
MSNCKRGPRSGPDGGFAYIWTLLLVAFMGVGSSIASELYSTSVRRDRERELLFIGHEFRAAIARYHDSAAGGPQMYPLTLQELIKDPRFPNARRHLRRLYADPITGKAEWGLIKVEGRIVGVHSLSQRAPMKVDNFDEHDSGFRNKGRYADWVFVYPHDMFIAPQDGEEGKNGGPLRIGVLPKPGAPR